MYVWQRLQRGHIWLIDVSKGRFDSLCQFARFIAEQSFLDSSTSTYVYQDLERIRGMFLCAKKKKSGEKFFTTL